MGGEWDSTNVADGQVAVFTPIALDHTSRLGKHGVRDRPHEIRHHQAGRLGRDGDPADRGARRVARGRPAQRGAARDRAGRLRRWSRRPSPSAGRSSTCAVARAATPTSSCRSTATTRRRTPRSRSPRSSRSSATAPGRSDQDVVVEGFGGVTSPGRLQLVGIEPTVLVDAAHNPHGAASLRRRPHRVLRLRRVRTSCWGSSPTRMPTASSRARARSPAGST